MNCCQGKNDHNGNDHKGSGRKHMSHMLMMVMCCGAPLLLLLLLPFIGNIFPGSNIYISKIIPFICPIMMIFMLPMMFKKDCGHSGSRGSEIRQLEDER